MNTNSYLDRYGRALHSDWKNGISVKIRLGELKGIGNVKTHDPRKAGLAARTPYHGVNQHGCLVS
jgi:hypothetical protein